jgi:SAM-dependent methyltransferase
MPALDPDYDNDPERSRSFRTAWQEDVHAPVADRLIADKIDSVLDVGCGTGRFATALQGRLNWIGLDASPRQIADCSYRPAIQGDATCLPLANQSIDAVMMLWMLYHLNEPQVAISEAKRVLQRGGLFAACTSSRTNDPELVLGGYPRTTFDAEEAGDIVADVFGAPNTKIERWDVPLVQLGDRDEVAAYARSHLLSASTVEDVQTPLTLTKRGCLIWARKPE